LKQNQVEECQIVSNTCRKHNPTSTLQISTIFNCYGPIGDHFGGLIDIAKTKKLYSMDESLLLEQEHMAAFLIVNAVNNMYRKNNATRPFKVANIYNSHGPRGGS
jgi:hypothetical protein